MAELAAIYAYIAPNDAGNEGLALIAFEDGGILPLVFQSLEDAQKARPLVAEFEKATGKTATLIKFNRETTA